MLPADIQFKLPAGFEGAKNIADLLDDDTLMSIGADLKEQVARDIESRKDWLERNDKWMELVTQVIEAKSFPWPDASNIKFPLISTAAVQFHARAFPALLGNNKPVKAKIIGRDEKGLKRQRADRVSTMMSYQVLEKMEGWVDDMDRLLFLVPIIGSLYKKTYYSESKHQIVSELINPRDFIINYDATEQANARKSHRIWNLPNRIKEFQNRGLYRTFDGDEVMQPSKVKSDTEDKIAGKTSPGIADDYSLQEFFEVHCMFDFDNDGYKEPYICTIRADGAVYRIVANYTEVGVEREGNKIIAIQAEEYFTHYFFLPDPESKTHGLGFGTMVGPINEAVNTMINQLTDAGTLSNLQGGFLSRGVRMKGGAVKFKPGEWKAINSTGDDLRKGIYPMPVREPSMVLFQLMSLLIDSGKDLSSVQDIMVGRNPGQNQPYSTSREVIEQGMKVFNGIYKRLYRSMTSEFKKIYVLNRRFPNIEMYKQILDMDGQELEKAEQQWGKEKVIQFLSKDFVAEDIDVIPTAEPDMIAEVQKLNRGMSLMEKRSAGMPINVQEMTRRVLEAEGHEDIPALMNVPPPQPTAEVKLKLDEFEWKKKIEAVREQREDILAKSQILKMDFEGQLALAKAQDLEVEGIHTQFIAQQQLIRDEFNAVTARLKVLSDDRKERQTGPTGTETAKPNGDGKPS